MKEHDASADKTRLARLIGSMARAEGFTQTGLAGVRLLRSSTPHPPTPVTYKPSIVIVAQGRKRGYLGGEVYTYDPDNYLVMSVPLPFECETLAGPEAPLLALSVGVDVAVLGELLLEMDHPDGHSETPRGMCSCALTGEIRGTAIRLLECLGSPMDSRILGGQIVREIVYRVLCGEQGAALRALARKQGSFSQIARALRRMHTEYDRTLDVGTLAKEANMSVSVFHQHFKSVTSTSPIQYLKSIRLHKARMMMSQEGLNANVAAVKVGYVSPSQFSREFKRYFGSSPVEEAAKLRGASL